MVGTGMERHSILGLKLQNGFLWRSGYRNTRARQCPPHPRPSHETGQQRHLVDTAWLAQANPLLVGGLTGWEEA